jgi:hypothetical protein
MATGDKSEKKAERNIDKLVGSSERLEKRISDLEAGLTSMMDQQFDANVYRKALAHTVQEHVFTKIQKAVLIVGALGSIGFVVMARGFIKDQVDEAIKAQYAGFTAATDEAERTSLLLLLNDASLGNIFAQRTIRDRMEELGPRLEKFISEPRSPQERTLAMDLYEREPLPRLRDELVTLFEDESAPAEDRRAALRVLLRDASGNAGIDVNSILRTAQGSGFRRDAASVLAAQRTSSREIADFVSSAVRNDTSTLRSAVLFFVVNPELWDYDAYYQHLFPRGGKQRELSPYQLIIDVATAESITGELQNAAEAVESKGTAGRDSIFEAFFSRHLALAFLRQGEPDRFHNVLSQAAPTAPIYPESVWRGTILPLFPELNDREDAEQVYSLYDISLLVSTQLQGSSWTGSSYESCSAASSVDQLTRGDLDCYLQVMSSGYYEPQQWLRSVVPLFPDYADAGAEGIDAEQDELWNWVQRTELEFDPGSTRYSCANSTACRPLDLGELPTDGRSVTVGGAVQGRLGAGNPVLADGSSGQAWALQGQAGASYTIELLSTDFDAFIYFVGPGLAEPLYDDDGAGNGNSRLEVELPQTGVYTVIVSSYEAGEQGAYELRVQGGR